MKNSKKIMPASAIFVALLMLMTTTIAGPMQDSTYVEAVENEYGSVERLEELLNELFTKVEDDQQFRNLLSQVTYEEPSEGTAGRVRDDSSSLTDSELGKMVEKEEFVDFENYIKSQYGKDLKNIERQISKLKEILAEVYTTNTEEFLTLGPPIDSAIIPVDGLQGITGSSDSAGSPDFMINDWGILYIKTHDLSMDTDGTTHHEVDGGWRGFPRNLDGDIYVDGVGWISADDPAYYQYLALEESLFGLTPGEIGDILSIVGYLMRHVLAPISYAIALIFIGLMYNAAENGNEWRSGLWGRMALISLFFYAFNTFVGDFLFDLGQDMVEDNTP